MPLISKKITNSFGIIFDFTSINEIKINTNSGMKIINEVLLKINKLYIPRIAKEKMEANNVFFWLIGVKKSFLKTDFPI